MVTLRHKHDRCGAATAMDYSETLLALNCSDLEDVDRLEGGTEGALGGRSIRYPRLILSVDYCWRWRLWYTVMFDCNNVRDVSAIHLSLLLLIRSAAVGRHTLGLECGTKQYDSKRDE